MVQYFLMSSQRRKSVKKYSFSQDFFGLQKKWRDKEVVSKWMPQTCLRGRISTKPNEKNQNFLFWGSYHGVGHFCNKNGGKKTLKNLPVKLKGWNFKGYYIIEYFSLWHKENATLFNLWKF